MHGCAACNGGSISLADGGADTEAPGSSVPAGSDAGKLAELLGFKGDDTRRSAAAAPDGASVAARWAYVLARSDSKRSKARSSRCCSVTDRATRKVSKSWSVMASYRFSMAPGRKEFESRALQLEPD